MKITQGPSPAPTNTCAVPGGQCTKSHARRWPLLALDDRQALAGQHEEVLLVVLAVVHPAGLAGLEHGERVADLAERHGVVLEDARVGRAARWSPTSASRT